MKLSLNPAQFEATHHVHGPLLVLAGAGSGKTRILTARMVHLVESGQAFPGEILALTFTNKAARVMRERVEKLLQTADIPTDDLWISTFHSMGAKLLRIYGSRIGLDPSFTIFDDSDQLSVVKECMEQVGLSDKVVSPRAIVHRINMLKNEGQNPKQFKGNPNSFFESRITPVVQLYDTKLEQNNSVDFGDLIYKTLRLFREDLEFRNMFQSRYRFIMVDEYQDTNAVQYELLKLMTEKERNIFVVGDEDQSIYRWRGADIRNILDFEKDYPETKIIKLEENYRSSKKIIQAANSVIKNNKLRKEKVLFTSREEGDPIEVHVLENEYEESKFVVQKVKNLLEKGYSLTDMAIFYRTNAQSRMFEDRLRYDRIAYKVFGGLKFYERAEIKDALAYIRLFVNPKDEISLCRIVNNPPRGIGRSTIDAVKQFSFKEKIPLLESLGMAAKGESGLGTGPRKKLQAFMDIYARIQAKLGKMGPTEFYSYILDEVGYLKVLEAEATIESASRLENLKELGNAISDYENRVADPTLAGFLEEVALLNNPEEDEETNFISLMTIHSAKGLEYKVVFLVGLEEELFPSARKGETDEDSESVEEERRLCYVGITRAEEKLFLTSAQMRKIFGVSHIRRPSRFIEELPKDEIRFERHNPQAHASRFRLVRGGDELGFGDGGSFDDQFSQDSGRDEFPDFEVPSGNDAYKLGVRVKHPDYGEGTVIRREGQSEGLKVTIQFQRFGSKKFVVKYAPLELLP